MDRQALRYPSHASDARAGLSHPGVWIASIWLGFGVVSAAQTVFVMRQEGMHHAWLKLFVAAVFFWLPWALATAPIVRLGRLFPPTKWTSIAGWSVHLAACSAVGLTFTAWTTWMEKYFNLYDSSSSPEPFVRLWFDKFSSGILSSLVLYAGILAVSYLVESRARLAYQQTETTRLNEQLVLAQLDALRRQIEPHFLFNTLNAISGLIRGGKDEAAVTMIARLSDLLRSTLEAGASQSVSLEEELRFTEQYLEIQKVRFADRLHVSMSVPSELHRAEVPSLILQPIVENAVRHGIANRLQGGTIRVCASRCNEILTLTVSNDGPCLPATVNAGLGIGNTNVRTRLKSLYGDAFDFTMRNAATGGVEVSVSLPYRAKLAS